MSKVKGVCSNPEHVGECECFGGSPERTQCGHNDQFGICPLERGHSGEHAKVPHRAYSDAELAQAEARGVQSGLEMAATELARIPSHGNCNACVIYKSDALGAIRALQPIPQAPQGERQVLVEQRDGSLRWCNIVPSSRSSEKSGLETPCNLAQPPTGAVRDAEVPNWESFEDWYAQYLVPDDANNMTMLRDAFAAGSEVTASSTKENK